VRRPKFVQKVEESKRKLDAKEQEHLRLQDELKAAGDEAQELEPQLTEKKSAVAGKKQEAKATADALRRTQSELRGILADRRQVMLLAVCKRL